MDSSLTFTLSLFNKNYLPDSDSSWSARPSGNLLAALHRASPIETVRWIACVNGYKIALGEPVFESKNWSRTLYLPEWFCFQVGIQGMGERVEVEFVRAEDLEKAKVLHFQSVGESEDLDLEIRDFLEEPLSSLGVLKEGMLLPVEALNLHLLVTKVEPCGEAFLDGHDIGFVLEEKPKEKEKEKLIEKEVTPQSFVSGGGMLGSVLQTSPLTQTQTPLQRGNCRGSRLLNGK